MSAEQDNFHEVMQEVDRSSKEAVRNGVTRYVFAADGASTDSAEVARYSSVYICYSDGSVGYRRATDWI